MLRNKQIAFSSGGLLLLQRCTTSERGKKRGKGVCFFRGAKKDEGEGEGWRSIIIIITSNVHWSAPICSCDIPRSLPLKTHYILQEMHWASWEINGSIGDGKKKCHHPKSIFTSQITSAYIYIINAFSIYPLWYDAICIQTTVYRQNTNIEKMYVYTSERSERA